MTKVIIADDEPLMRDRLAKMVRDAWPEANIVAEAKNGLEALEAFHAHQPAALFLDIRMPGKTGLEVAAEVGDAAHVVFVTAYDEYAVKAFEDGAADYLMKPVELDRMQAAVARIQKRMAANAAPQDLTALVAQLLNRSEGGVGGASKLKWIRASLGNQTRLINVDDVLFFQSDSKYTRIVMKDSEALVRSPLKEIVAGLDEEAFWQVHRSTIVAVSAIDRAIREGPEKLTITLRDHKEKLAVSRQYFQLFRQN
ncbi:MAG: response regulator transcription factor [Betaproteobacteria bacterium]|nr:response regulator transcription factor [Betaproteobacteria bacterium]